MVREANKDLHASVKYAEDVAAEEAASAATEHEAKTSMHVSAEDRSRWNNPTFSFAPLSGQTINTNTTHAMRQAIKTIGEALGATMRVLAVCAALPLLGASVQSAPLGDLDLDTNPSVVTNVDLSGILSEEDGAAIQGDIAGLRTESALVYRLYQGSNVVAEVTTYNSQVHAPELRLLQLNESNEYITVWSETNGLARTLSAANRYTDAAITNSAAPKAWSKVTAGMGVEAPSNTTWLSTARTVIAGGLEYEKHVTGGGAIWLLESNGMTADFHAQTNNTAFLDLSNADGTPIFRIEKTDSFLVGVHVDDVTVDGDALVCQVGVVAAEHPLVRVRASLSSGEWIKEEDGIPSSLATVTWSGTAGNWTCRIRNNTGGGSFFAQMEYLQEGGTKIVNSAPMDISQGIIVNGVKYVPVANGSTLTWQAAQ